MEIEAKAKYLERYVDVYRRNGETATYDWRRMSPNGRVVATSGGQGYSNKSNARNAAILENPGLPIYYVEET